MADSFRPWICAYLIDIGETYGGNLSDVPYWEKKKKVQVVEFLTFPTSAEDPCPIYAKLADKLHKIPARISTDALEAYSKKNNGRRLTENRSALVQIKNFRPTFCRVPIGNNVRKQSPDSHLVFEVGSVEVLGSEGEGEFGNPKDIEENEKVMAWTEGLREHGGGGNVLKLRKEVEQGSGEAETSPTRASRLPARKVVQSLPRRNNQVGKKRAESGSKATSVSSPKHGVSAVNHAMDLYKREFRRVLKDSERFRIGFRPQEVEDQQCNLTFDKDFPVAAASRAASEEPPPPAQRPPTRRSPPKRHALDLDSSQPQMASPERKQSIPPMPTTPTPSEWPASQPNSRHHLDVSDMDVDAKPGSEPPPEDVSMSQEVAIPAERQPSPSSKPSSHLSAPTPAQRPNPLSPSVSSSPIKSTPSSVPRPSIQTPSRPSSSPRTSLPIHMRRRVPYPTPPVPPDPDISGFGRILVPNSDTSGLSQSQSQSQARSEQQHPSQPNFFPTMSQDVSWARTNGHMPTSDHADDSNHVPVSQPPVRPSQPESYDGDRSSPELPSQPKKDKEKEHTLDPVYEVAKTRSLSPRSQEPFKPEVVEQEDNEEDVDQLQSDAEQPNDEGDHVGHSPRKDLSDDDAQIHAMLTRDSPQNGEPPDPVELPFELPARISPAPRRSVKDNVKRGDVSTAVTILQSPPAIVSNGSRKQSRAPSPARPSSSMAPPPVHQASKNAKISIASGGAPFSSSPAVEHDAEAWKNPSFMRSATKDKMKPEPTVHATTNTTKIDKGKSLPAAASSDALRLTEGSLHESDAGAGVKAMSMKGQTSRASIPVVVAGPSRPNKRVQDRLSESSSRSSSILRGDSGSGSKTKKRKIEASELAASISSGRSGAVSSAVQIGIVEDPVKPEPQISNDAPTGSGSGSNMKRELEADRPGSRAASSTSSSRPRAVVGDVEDEPVKHESRISNDASGSGKGKKRKIEAGESAGSTSSSRSGTAMGVVEAETIEEEPRLSNDAPAASGSVSRKKRRIDFGESVSGRVSASGSTSSHDVRMSDPRREKNGKAPSSPSLDNEPLLKGFTFDFLHLPPESGGPRLRTWHDIKATLLAIGKETTPRGTR